MLHLPRESVSSENARVNPSPIIAPAAPVAKARLKRGRSRHPLLRGILSRPHTHSTIGISTQFHPLRLSHPLHNKRAPLTWPRDDEGESKGSSSFRLCKPSPVQAQRCIVPLCSQKTWGSTTGQLSCTAILAGGVRTNGWSAFLRCLSSQTALPRPHPGIGDNSDTQDPVPPLHLWGSWPWDPR